MKIPKKLIYTHLTVFIIALYIGYQTSFTLNEMITPKNDIHDFIERDQFETISPKERAQDAISAIETDKHQTAHNIPKEEVLEPQLISTSNSPDTRYLYKLIDAFSATNGAGKLYSGVDSFFENDRPSESLDSANEIEIEKIVGDNNLAIPLTTSCKLSMCKVIFSSLDSNELSRVNEIIATTNMEHFSEKIFNKEGNTLVVFLKKKSTADSLLDFRDDK